MSHAVARGKPEKCQLYLDSILDSIIKNGGTRAKSREEVNIAEIIFHCFKTNPDAVHTINAATGEKFTNLQILRRAVSIAHALKRICGTRTAIIMLRNTEHMSALFYAVLMAGVVPFMMEPRSTECTAKECTLRNRCVPMWEQRGADGGQEDMLRHVVLSGAGSTPPSSFSSNNELQQFLPLVSPCIIFCEEDREEVAISAVAGSDVRVVIADGPGLDQFVEGCSEDIDSFQLPEVDAESTAFIMPTSGSTGVPKAAMMSHAGMIMQMPCTWVHFNRFPKPTGLALLASTCQWMTHTIIMTSFPVYQVPILMTPLKITAEYLAELSGQYHPTWAIVGPSLAAPLGHLATADQLSSFDRLYVGGSPFSPDILAPLKEKIPAGNLLNGYGMTEVHGFVAGGPPGISLLSSGQVVNVLDYRIINEKGELVKEPYEKGELYLKGKCLIKGYVNNEVAFRGSMTPDGWLKTGDVFYRDEKDMIFFVNRTKLSFKYLNHHVYPEEIERIIGTLPGIQQCVVVGAEAGPAAAVVLQAGCNVTREDIHKSVNSTLSDYKRLRGGIAFVTSLPSTHSGKIDRNGSRQLIQELSSSGECF